MDGTSLAAFLFNFAADIPNDLSQLATVFDRHRPHGFHQDLQRATGTTELTICQAMPWNPQRRVVLHPRGGTPHQDMQIECAYSKGDVKRVMLAFVNLGLRRQYRVICHSGNLPSFHCSLKCESLDYVRTDMFDAPEMEQWIFQQLRRKLPPDLLAAYAQPASVS